MYGGGAFSDKVSILDGGCLPPVLLLAMPDAPAEDSVSEE